jgi:hypothetical protein
LFVELLQLQLQINFEACLYSTSLDVSRSLADPPRKRTIAIDKKILEKSREIHEESCRTVKKKLQKHLVRAVEKEIEKKKKKLIFKFIENFINI